MMEVLLNWTYMEFKEEIPDCRNVETADIPETLGVKLEELSKCYFTNENVNLSM